LIIKNREELISSGLRARAIELIEAGVTRVLPANLLRQSVRYDQAGKRLIINGTAYHLSKGRLFVVGGGKAAGLMSEEIERIIGPEMITAGIVNCKTDDHDTKKIEVIRAGHPVPDEAGMYGVRSMLAMKGRYDLCKNDLVLCLISGGGSSLMPCPVTGVSLEDKQNITKLLIRCGADIKEVNTVRKHLSLTKGGGLGKYYEPARVVSLIISDVPGDDLDAVASGPTVPDLTTFREAYAILGKYGLLKKAPLNVVNFIKRGCDELEAETPKGLFNCDNYIIGNNRMALDAMEEKARDLGLKTFTFPAELTGDTTSVAKKMAKKIIDGHYRGFDVILIGAETTPTLPEKAGKGGRNQHYAAVSMLAMEGCTFPWLIASTGTDGYDFLTDVAGAIVDNRSLGAAAAAGINVQDYIDRFDSNTLFKKLGRSLIVTGPTGTNVSDVLLYLLG
jgi:glycerate 2-kinase